jgi:hypothetical protein
VSNDSCKALVTLMLLYGPSPLLGQARILTADPRLNPYQRIESVLHAPPETPDCGHPAFGPHITQTMDDELGIYVFVFTIHVRPDDDRCILSDRQRVEVKTMGNPSTPDYLKASRGDSVTFRWRFRLSPGFQPSTRFTHLHQIKAYGGDDAAPLITLTARKGSPDMLQLIYIPGRDSINTHPHGVQSQTPLAPFVGVWLEVYEKFTRAQNGTYSIVINRVSDERQMFSYSAADLDLDRTGAAAIRPKWGIYRSLEHAEQLRDEQVRFAGFCLAEGKDDCSGDVFGHSHGPMQ